MDKKIKLQVVVALDVIQDDGVGLRARAFLKENDLNQPLPPSPKHGAQEIVRQEFEIEIDEMVIYRAVIAASKSHAIRINEEMNESGKILQKLMGSPQ